MKTIAYLILFAVSVCYGLMPGTCGATTAYVNDLCQVNLRSGPGTNYKVVATLSSGFVIEVIEQKDEWSKVRFAKEDGKSTEGWIMNRFLANEPPWAGQAKTVDASLKEKLAGAKEENVQLGQREEELKQALVASTDKLKKLEADYESLKTGSADYLQLKDQYEATKTALAQAQEDVRSLSREIEDLKLSKGIRWFIAGALVLVGGWVIGVFMGRYQRKRRTHFHV